jgi:outer membrane protein assembly factor BamD (BamD/ComL family)
MRIRTLFLIVVFLFSVGNYCQAQEMAVESPTLSTGERLRQVEEILRVLQSPNVLREMDLLRKAERELKGILKADPSTVFKSQVEASLDIVNERLAHHDLVVANFYMNMGHRLRGARGRLENIVRSYPKFSKMDEVLFRLNVVSVQEEKQDEAARYCWTLICNYPNSEYVRAAFEQLNEIGVSSWQGCEQYKS